jgi:hypothetical protein
VDVILPAGGRIEGDFAREAGAEVKALIPLGRRTLLDTVLEAVRATGYVNRAVVVGPDAVQKHADSSADAFLPERGSGPENIFHGFEWLGKQTDAADHVLILTTDLPFILPDSVSGFLNRCPPDSDICLPLFEKSDFECRFQGSQNTYVKLRDGEWTVGGAYRLRRQALEKNREHIDRLFHARKSAAKMAKLLGPLFIARYLTRTLRVPHLECHCARLTGCAAAAVKGCDPALAFDIDDIHDYRYAVNLSQANDPLSATAS